MPSSAGQVGSPNPDTETIALADQVWARLHARIEQRLTRLEGLVSALFDRSLEPTEILEGGDLCGSIASTLGTLGFPSAADLIRRVATLLQGEELGLSEAIAMASLFDDARIAIATIVSDLRILNHTGFHIKIVGSVTNAVDELIWLASSQSLVVSHDSDGLSEEADSVDAVLVVVEDPELARARPLIRGIREAHPHQPIVLLAPTDVVAERARVVEWTTTIIDSGTHPLEVIAEVRQAVARVGYSPSVSVIGEGAAWVAEELARRGMESQVEESVEDLFESLRSGQSRSVVITPSLGLMEPIQLLRVIRSDRFLRPAAVVVIEKREDAARVHAIRREGADDVVAPDVDLDDLVVLLKSRLARRAVLEPIDQRDGTSGAVPWETAVVLMERMLTVSFRRHSPVGIALIQFVTTDKERASGELDENIAREFRREDVIARVDDDHLVVALQGVDRATIQRRMHDLLQKFSLHERGSKAACVQFPLDGRSLDELLENADVTLQAAGTEGAPTVLGFDWEPPSARVADVLLVDPDTTLGSVLTTTLQRRGLSVEQQPDSLEALSHLTGATDKPLPKVVLLELDLRGIDGLQFLRQLREAGTLNRCRVIVLSARTHESDLRLAFEIGADDFVAKPFSTPLLMHRLNRALMDGRRS